MSPMVRFVNMWAVAALLAGILYSPARAEHRLVLKAGAGTGVFLGYGSGELNDDNRIFWPIWIGFGTQFGIHFQLDLEGYFGFPIGSGPGLPIKICGTLTLSFFFLERDAWLRPLVRAGIGGGLLWWRGEKGEGERSHGLGPFLIDAGVGVIGRITDSIQWTAEVRTVYGLPDEKDAAALLFLVGLQAGFF